MRLLIDNALSPAVAVDLRHAGHDVEHVRNRGMGGASDADIIEPTQVRVRMLPIMPSS